MDISTLRSQTPACDSVIHFNNAGASLAPRPVTESLLRHLMLEQKIGGYEAAEDARELIENCYRAIARLINCNAREVAFAHSATEAWNVLLQAIPFEPGDRIITGQSEYAGNYLSLLHLARRQQIDIDVVDNNEDGTLDLEQLKQKLDSDVRLIALTHIPSQSGVIHPAVEVGKLARRHRIFYLLDASQSVGQLPLDVNTLGCDMLVGTGRKYLRGPRGTGFIYVRHAIIEYLEPQIIDLHSASWNSRDIFTFRDDARRFETFEKFIAGQIALGRAADYAADLGMDNISIRVQQLARMMRQSLETLPDVTVHETGNHLSGIVTFSRSGESATDLHRRLLRAGINTSVVRQVNTRLDFERRGLQDINRASVHYYNTEAEIEQFCDAVTSAQSTD